MATPENLAKFRSLLSTFANLIREGEGTTEPISGAEMRQRLSELDVYHFYLSTKEGQAPQRRHLPLHQIPLQ